MLGFWDGKLDHVQTICTSFQTDNHTNSSSYHIICVSVCSKYASCSKWLFGLYLFVEVSALINSCYDTYHFNVYACRWSLLTVVLCAYTWFKNWTTTTSNLITVFRANLNIRFRLVSCFTSSWREPFRLNGTCFYRPSCTQSQSTEESL